MTANPYDYENRMGIHPVTWTAFHGLCKGLARAVAPYDPQIILAVGRGGFYPGTLIAHLLRVEVYPVRVSRRVRDVVRHDQPQWFVRPPEAVRGQRILVVDEISSTGETLQIVSTTAAQLGAAEVRRVVLYAHSWSAAIPDYIGLVSDALILNPWDREVLIDGQFVVHPEYAAALREQGLPADESVLVGAAEIPPAKSGPTDTP